MILAPNYIHIFGNLADSPNQWQKELSWLSSGISSDELVMIWGCSLTLLCEDLPLQGPTRKASPPGYPEPTSVNRQHRRQNISTRIGSKRHCTGSWQQLKILNEYKMRCKMTRRADTNKSEMTLPSARSPWRSACTKCHTGCNRSVPESSHLIRWV